MRASSIRWAWLAALAGVAIAQACDRDDTGTPRVDEQEQALDDLDDGERVLGKRAFDGAAAGYPTFEPLGAEAQRRTLQRADDRIALLERDLWIARVHVDARQPDATAIAADLDHVAHVLAEARVRIGHSDGDDPIDDSEVEIIVSLVNEAQLALQDVARPVLRDRAQESTT